MVDQAAEQVNTFTSEQNIGKNWKTPNWNFFSTISQKKTLVSAFLLVVFMFSSYWIIYFRTVFTQYFKFFEVIKKFFSDFDQPKANQGTKCKMYSLVFLEHEKIILSFKMWNYKAIPKPTSKLSRK